jgi:HK97 family phage prohead protease
MDAADGATLFAVDSDSIPAQVLGIDTYASPVARAPRIDRATAIQVPAVKQSRDLIAGVLGALPIDVIGPGSSSEEWRLLDQPEKDVPRSVTMTRLFEDLLFEGIAWWRIVEFGWHSYPTRVKRLDPSRVAVDDEAGRVYVDGKHVDDSQLIRFDSPTDALLVAGARAIRTCLGLDAAAGTGGDTVPPVDYFTPADGIDAMTEDEVSEFLTGWSTARAKRRTGYVPGGLDYKTAGWNPEQLQLRDQRQHAVLEIARTAGVDPEYVGVSTTTRTYVNAQDRRKSFLDFTLGLYRQAVEDRLSMGDTTPRGHSVKFNLSSFLRSDDKTRMETYEIGERVGAYTRDEIRELEDRPALSADQQPAAPAPAVSADTTPVETFDDEPQIRLDAPQDAAAFEVDTERRIIRGLAVPYGVVGFSGGQKWQFSRGTLRFTDPRRVKLWVQHDKTKAIGVATTLEDRPEGLFAEFKVARGADGDRALELAEDGVLDGLSIGLKQGGRFATRHGVNHAIEAPLMEVSLTPAPSFDDARVHAVAASATQGDTIMPLTAQERARLAALRAKTDLTDAERQEMNSLAAREGVVAADATGGASDAPTFDTTPITDAIREGFAGLAAPQGRETVSATAGGQFEVDEAPAYRFDGIPGEHSLTEDMRSALGGDSEARQRLDEFFNETFAVTTGNTGSLNPTQHRPDLYVPNLTYSRPLWDSISTGTITDRTPFTVPKFASAAGLVGRHTEGVEPTPGSFSATSQTITPQAVSGKVEINREVLDQGGSPQADAIIWGEMLNGYYEALEAGVAQNLASVATTEINLGGATDAALVDQFTAIMSSLLFVRGGNRFTRLVLDGKTFPALVDAADTTGRKLLPVIGPTNAQGQVSGAFDRISIGNLDGRAAWALGAGDDAQSYLFVPSSVWGWASPPRRFTFEYQVKSVDIAIWGYDAHAVLRDSDVRPIDYTTAD